MFVVFSVHAEKRLFRENNEIARQRCVRTSAKAESHGVGMYKWVLAFCAIGTCRVRSACRRWFKTRGEDLGEFRQTDSENFWDFTINVGLTRHTRDLGIVYDVLIELVFLLLHEAARNKAKSGTWRLSFYRTLMNARKKWMSLNCKTVFAVFFTLVFQLKLIFTEVTMQE